MSKDRRELLLARLEAILVEQQAGDITVYRDRAAFGDDDLPAYVLLDGNEEETGIESSSHRGPQIMLLLPQIFYVPVPPENRKNEGMGPSLSAHRNKLLKAIKTDDRLLQIAGSNGYIRYRGMITDMNTGAEVEGQFQMNFAIAYPLDVNEL